VIVELALIDWFQDKPKHFLNNAIFEGRYAKRPHLTVGFWYEHPSYRQRGVLFALDLRIDFIDQGVS